MQNRHMENACVIPVELIAFANQRNAWRPLAIDAQPAVRWIDEDQPEHRIKPQDRLEYQLVLRRLQRLCMHGGHFAGNGTEYGDVARKWQDIPLHAGGIRCVRRSPLSRRQEAGLDDQMECA